MNSLDLFSGIGGMSLGLESAGIDTAAFCEVDKNCLKVLKNHWPSKVAFTDICHTYYKNGKLIGKTTTSDYSVACKIDLICGGYPCTGHSIAGKKEGFKNEASSLWEHYKRLIGEVRPRFVIIENSANLRNTGLAKVLKNLCTLGYNAEWEIVPARSVGSEHKRERIYIVAWDKATAYPDAFRLWRATPSEKKEPIRGAKTALCFRSLFMQARRHQPSVGRGIHGLSDWMDGLERERKERIKMLGNTLVPIVPYLIGLALMDTVKKESQPSLMENL